MLAGGTHLGGWPRSLCHGLFIHGSLLWFLAPPLRVRPRGWIGEAVSARPRRATRDPPGKSQGVYMDVPAWDETCGSVCVGCGSLSPSPPLCKAPAAGHRGPTAGRLYAARSSNLRPSRLSTHPGYFYLFASEYEIYKSVCPLHPLRRCTLTFYLCKAGRRTKTCTKSTCQLTST